jgi:hypothetical protein
VLLDGELQLALRRAELDWTRALIEDLRGKTLWWTREDLVRQFEKHKEQATR